MLNGYISLNGPNGFNVALRHPITKLLGNLPGDSELFELFRQATELLLSGKPEGPLCGSERKFRVTTSGPGTPRSLRINLVGVTYWLNENTDKRKRYDATFTIIPDFIFPESGDNYSNSDSELVFGDTVFNG